MKKAPMALTRGAGRCSLIRGGERFELVNPRVVGWAAGSKHMPIPVRLTLLGLRARDFLLLDRAVGQS